MTVVNGVSELDESPELAADSSCESEIEELQCVVCAQGLPDRESLNKHILQHVQQPRVLLERVQVPSPQASPPVSPATSPFSPPPGSEQRRSFARKHIRPYKNLQCQVIPPENSNVAEGEFPAVPKIRILLPQQLSDQVDAQSRAAENARSSISPSDKVDCAGTNKCLSKTDKGEMVELQTLPNESQSPSFPGQSPGQPNLQHDDPTSFWNPEGSPPVPAERESGEKEAERHDSLLQNFLNESVDSLVNTKDPGMIIPSNETEFISLERLAGPQCSVCSERFVDQVSYDLHCKQTGHYSNTLVPYSGGGGGGGSGGGGGGLVGSSSLGGPLDSLAGLPMQQLAQQVNRLQQGGGVHQQNVLINIQQFGQPMAPPPSPYGPGPADMPPHMHHMPPHYGQQQQPHPHPMHHGMYMPPHSQWGPAPAPHHPLHPHGMYFGPAPGPPPGMYGPHPPHPHQVQQQQQQQPPPQRPPGPSPPQQQSSPQPPQLRQQTSSGSMMPPRMPPPRLTSQQMRGPPQQGGVRAAQQAGPARAAAMARAGMRMNGPRGPGPQMQGMNGPRGPASIQQQRAMLAAKRNAAVAHEQQLKKKRLDVLIPGSNESDDCHVISMQKCNDGMPIIKTVQGAATTVADPLDPVVHLTDSITLSVRNPKEAAPVTQQKKNDAKAVANILATRGITVTPATKSQKELAASQPPKQAAPVAINLNSAVSIIPTARNQQGSKNGGTSTAGAPSNGDKNSKSTPTVDLTDDEPTASAKGTTPNKRALPHQCDLCPAQYPSMRTLVIHRRQYHKAGPQSELGVPIVDLSQPTVLARLAGLGIHSYIPLPQATGGSAAGSGTFGLPIVSVNAARNPGICNIGALGSGAVLTLGPLQHISNLPASKQQ